MADAQKKPRNLNEEVAINLRKLGWTKCELPLLKELLENPKNDPSSIQSMYRFLVSLILRIPEEQFESPDFRQFERTEEHAKPISHANLAIVCSRIFDALFEKLPEKKIAMNFIFDDLAYPDPKKTVRFLSYLIKLVEVKAMTDPVVNDLRKQQRQIVEIYETHQTEAMELQKRIEAAKKREQERKIVIKQLQNEKETLKQQLDHKREYSRQLNRENTALEQEFERVKNAADRLNAEVSNSKAELMRLTSQIVSSPKRLEKDLDRMNKLYQEKLAEMNAAKGQLSATLQRCREEYPLIAQKVEFVLKASSEIIAMEEKHREKSLELQKKKECYNAARQSLSNLDLENEQCKIRLKQKEQELATVYQQYALEAEEIEAKHRKLTGNIETIKMQQEQDEIAANDLNNEALKLREEISALETKYTSMTNEILRSVAEYDQTVDRHELRLRDVVNELEGMFDV